MPKLFFYKIVASDLLAYVTSLPENERGTRFLELAIDLVARRPSSEFSSNIINEATVYTQKKKDAANKRWKCKSDALHMHSISNANAQQMPIAVTVTEKNKEESIRVGAKKFAPPSLQEVVEYCKERKNDVDPQRWFNFYSAKGWLIGTAKMKDWKAAVRTWEKKSVDVQPKNEVIF